MKNLYKLFLTATCFTLNLSLLTNKSFASCDTTGCDAVNFFADLSGSPDTSWTVSSIVRNGYCCGAGGIENCIRIDVDAHPQAKFVKIEITAGAIPPGANYFKINCGPEVLLGEWTDISGLDSFCITFCKPGNNTNDYTVSILPPPSYPYCTPTYSNLCSSGDFINNFSFNTLAKNNSGCNGNANNYIRDTTVTTTVELGGSYNISMQAGTQYPQGFGVWIDYNQDGDFDDSADFIYASSTYGTDAFTGSVIIPDSATAGQTRLRVRCIYNQVPLSGESCGNFQYGETEDYTIALVQPPPCIEPPTAGTLSANKSVVCYDPEQITLSLSGGTSGWGQYYTGQFSSDGVTWTNAGNVIFPANINNNGSTYYRVYATCEASSDTTNIIYVQYIPIDSIDLLPVNVSCYGGNDGSVATTVFGGSPPYTYLWINGAQTQNISFLYAGTYDVTVTDANGCVNYSGTSVSQPSELGITPGSTDAGCGLSDGMVYVSVNNGTPPYSYNWSNSATTDSVPNLAAGTYYVTVTDNNSCTKTGNASVSETGGPGQTTSKTDVTCFGLNDGTATVSAFGGNTPFTYLWDAAAGNQTSTTATGLAPGTYYVTITNAVSCNTITSVTIVQPALLSLQVTADSVQCFGQNNGAAHAIVSGGMNPYTFLWSTAETTSDIDSLTAGTYSVTITDNNSCTATGTVAVEEPPALVPNLSVINATCFGLCNGKVVGGASGGTPPYSYSIPQIENYFSDTAVGICAGSYEVEVNDSRSCMVTDSIIIVEPAALIADAGPDAIICSGTTTTIGGSPSASGGTPPYTYLWNPSSGLSDANAANPEATLSSTTNFSLLVSDANNCTNSDSLTISIMSNPVITPTSVINISCNGGNNGQIYTAVTGGTGPYTYLWSNTATVPNINTLTAGAYSVTVTDANGCTGDIAVNVTEPTVLIADGGTNKSTCAGFPVTVGGSPAASGGTAPYSYSWSPTQGLSDPTIANPDASPTVTTSYSLAVTDNNGCVDSGFVNVTVTAPTTEVCDGIDNDCDGQTDEGITLVSNAGPDQELCNITSTTLSANTPTDGTGTWSVISGSATITNSTDPSTAISGMTLGTTTLRWTVSGGFCPAATDDVVISVYGSSHTVNAGMDAALCEGNTYQLSGTFGGSASSATWTTGGTGTFDNPNALSAVYTPSAGDIAAGTAMLTLTTDDPAGPCPAASDDMIITINLSPAVSTNSTNVSCNGGSDGTATSTPSGGTSPYSYLWSNSSVTQNIFSLTAGSYSLTLTDANGCTASATTVITEPASFVVNIGSQAETCSGDSSGYATVAATGGTAPYTYLWSNSATTDTITGLTAGTYGITITDANACTTTNSANIGTLSNLSIFSIDSTNITCNGGTDGTATVTPSGGATPYSYLWSNGGTNTIISNLSAGNYSVTVTDSYGCTATGNTTITEPSPLSVSITPSGSTTFCAGDSVILTASGGSSYLWSTSETTQSITVSMSGNFEVTITDGNGCTGTASQTVTVNAAPSPTVTPSGPTAFCQGDNVTLNSSAASSYMWSNGATTQSITVSSTGNFDVTVTDANGCAGSSPLVTVTMNVNPTVTLTPTNPTCNGGCNGSVLSFASGNSPFSYLWSNSATGSGISALCVGSYSITITDVNGCTVSDSATLTEPSALTASIISVVNASCSGFSDGSTTVSASGGTGSLTYSWSNGQTTATATALSAGTHTVTVTDANFCTTTDSATITQPSALSATASSTNSSCNGNADGSASVMANGGTGSYSYLWSNAATTDSINALSTGSYDVTVTDVNGCTATANAVVTEPTVVSASASSTDATCNGNTNGSASVMANGGTGAYSYLWSNAATTDSINALAAGSYDVTVTDANGCTATANAVVTEPSAVSASASSTNASCNGNSDGSASVLASGGTGSYSYLWSNAATTDSINALAAGGYDVTVTDANGCTATVNTIVTEPSAVSASTSSMNASCNGNADGSASVMANGGTGSYSYLWSNAATTDSINALAAGSYDVTVTDANGCTATANAVVTEPSAVSASASSTNASCNGNADGSASVMASGGTAPYSYLWSNSATTDSINGLASGSYDVTVTDANGCTATVSATVTEPSAISLSFSSFDVTCNNSCDGYAIVVPSGGTTPYTYLWLPTPGSGQGTASASQLCAGNYSLSITDNNGCLKDTTFTINEPVVLSAIPLSTDATCGASDGTATVTPTGGTSPWTYLWSNSQTTQTATGLSAGAYSITVTDLNNCTVTNIATVNNLAGPSVTISGTTDANCGGPDGSASTSVNGGTPPYVYGWSNGDSLATAENLTPGNYSVTVTDINNCSGIATATIGNTGTNAPSVSGSVTMFGSGFIVNDGEIRAYKVSSTPGQFALIATATITNGNYSFSSLLPIGNYIFLAAADSNAFPLAVGTYHGLTHKWEDAIVVNITCDSAFVIDIEVINLNSQNGNSKIQGVVIAVTTGKWQGYDLIMGDPVPGIDVSLEQVPGGIVAKDVTDNDGIYSFDSVPSGEKYQIYVDVPGLGMDSTYTLDLTSGDTTATNLDFYVGDTSIFIESGVFVTEIKAADKTEIRIYPNPFGTFANFEYVLKEKKDVKIEVYNLLGERIFMSSNQAQESGKYVERFAMNEMQSTGIYFVKFHIGEQVYSHRIVRAE